MWYAKGKERRKSEKEGEVKRRGEKKKERKKKEREKEKQREAQKERGKGKIRREWSEVIRKAQQEGTEGATDGNHHLKHTQQVQSDRHKQINGRHCQPKKSKRKKQGRRQLSYGVVLPCMGLPFPCFGLAASKQLVSAGYIQCFYEVWQGQGRSGRLAVISICKIHILR